MFRRPENSYSLSLSLFSLLETKIKSTSFFNKGKIYNIVGHTILQDLDKIIKKMLLDLTCFNKIFEFSPDFRKYLFYI